MSNLIHRDVAMREIYDYLSTPVLIDESEIDINIPLKSWINCEKNMYRTNIVENMLDNSYTKIDNIPGLKTTLFPHQKTIVRAMLDLENNRTFNLSDSTFNTLECKTTAGVLSEAVGSGKTIDILSVILMQKIPKVFPDISELKMIEGCNRNLNRQKSYFTCSIRKKFHNILKTTIIFAGVSVINQWVESIKTFTSLTYFVVFDVRDLQKLINKMSDKSINNYDVIIVKNGKVTRLVKFPKCIKIEDKNKDKTTMYIYNIIGNMRNFCWARVVIDDFDTIKLPHNAGIVNGLFTWYISSTQKTMCVKQNTNTFKNTSDMLMYSNYNCGNIMKNKLLFNNLNIRNSAEFVQNTNNINSPIFYAYTFINVNDQYIGFLSLLGDGEANEIMEMLNGDAIETAAERIGIKTDSVADIFQIMLGKQFEKYKKSVDVLDFITEVEPMQGTRTPMSENPDEFDTYNKTDLFIRREIFYNYPNLKGLLDGTKEEYLEVRRKSSIAIDRVKSNIKNGECAICLNELDDEEEDTMILKCCGNIVCGMCCFGTIFPKNSSQGQCSNCRAQLSLTGLIYLNSEFDLNKIVNEDFVEDKAEDKAEELEPKEEKKNQQPRTKMTAIIDIIQGRNPVEQKLVDVNINNLMKGTCVLPDASYNKVLIFANFDETIKKIKETLLEEKIDFWQLGGTHSEINKTVTLFTNCTHTCVLIVNSMKHCSGLNLQTATDLIFAHKIIDPNVETQVIGRGQRLGRTTTLKVHFMMYENEYNYMLRLNTIREL
jgi:SNF2 family DNA or RNA helicase